MTDLERLLLTLMEQITEDPNGMAVMLQSFIQENGPLSEEAAAKVRALLQVGQKS